MEPKHFYEFGPFRVDPDQRLLLRDNQPVPLQPKAFDTLLVLVRHGDTVVLKDELMKSVWPDTFVEESNLAQNIFVLRKALEKEGGEHPYVVTVPGRGYRFAEKVRFVPQPQQDDLVLQSRSITRVEISQESSPRREWRTARTAILVGAGVLAGAFAVWAFFVPSPMPKVLRSVQLTHSGRVEPSSSVLTDGSRLYFTERIGGTWSLAQIAKQGGEPALISSSIFDVALFDIDRSRSRLLVAQLQITDPPFDPLWVVPTAGGSAQRLGDILGKDAVWSPDGQSIAYSHQDELWTVAGDGQQPHRVLTANGFVESVRWSPDGRRLSFSVRSVATGLLTLWEITADSREPHPLPLPLLEKNRSYKWGDGECCGDWTPDGKYFVFRSMHEGVGSFWAVREKGNWFRRNPGTMVQLYTSPDQLGKPRLGADGKSIFFVDYQERRELVRYDSTRRLFVPYLHGIPARLLSFSRDGQWVAYRNELDGSLWRSRPGGTQAVQLTFPPLQALHSTWSPDGKKIAFEASGSLFVIPSEGGKPERLLPEGERGIQPNWSADGRLLFFARFDSGPKGWWPTLYSLDLNGRQVQMLRDSDGAEAPQCSPDGRYLAVSDRKRKKLMLVDLGSGKWMELSDGIPYGWGIRWSADSAYVYYQHLNGEEQPIFRVRVSNRKVEQITSSRQILRSDVLSYSLTGLSPDNSPLVSLVRRNSDVYALELNVP